MPRQMRIDELPPWQPSPPWQPPLHGQHGGFKPSTWPPPYLTEAHIQRLTDLMEKNGWEFDHAVEVLGMECAWTSRNFPHRWKAPPPQPPSFKKVPPMMTKTFAEEEARALFRFQEIDKVNKEMLQLAMVISEKETDNLASTGTSDEWTKVLGSSRMSLTKYSLAPTA